MIAFEYQNEFLDISKSFSLTIIRENPIFFQGIIPGEKIRSVKLLLTPRNQRLLGFPELLELSERNITYAPVRLYLHKLVYQTGTLKLRNAGTGGYDLNFTSNEGDIGLTIKNRAMPQVDLGVDAANYQTSDVYPSVNHIFFPIKNDLFYEDKNPDYLGYVNYYNNDEFVDNVGNAAHTRVPYPFMLYLLDQVFISLGYEGISGDWTTDPEIQKIAVYNNFALDKLVGSENQFEANIDYANHVPDISVGSFLIEIAISFGVFPKLNKDTNSIEFKRIKDVLNLQEYIEFESGKPYNFRPNDADGYEFISAEDTNDKLTEFDRQWLTFKVGNGKLPIETEASTLLAGDDEDTINARTWTIPRVSELGSSPEFELGDNRGKLRFLIYNGIKLDSLGNDYPQGHWLGDNTSLRWNGPIGLVEQNYLEWIDFMDNTITTQRDLRMTITDFLTFDFDKKILSDGLKYVIKDIKATITFDRGLQPVKATISKIKL